MKRTEQFCMTIAVLAVIILAFYIRQGGYERKDNFSSCASCSDPGDVYVPPPTVRQGEWDGGRGPYNLQLYDAPYFYPYYESRDYMAAWDNEGRCATYCRASGDGGCAVVCR